MNGFDGASAAVFASSVALVITAARRPKESSGMARRLFRSIAALTFVALATATIAVNGNLTTTLFVELTTCMLLVAAVIHAFAWSSWLAK